MRSGILERCGPAITRLGGLLLDRFARPARRRWLACALAIAVPWILSLPAVAQQVSEAVVNREYPLKALFLYNFGSYIEWPTTAFADAQAPFVIGILGKAPLEDTLNEIAAKKMIAGRKVVVQRFDSVDKLKPCNILFIPRTVSAAQQRAAIQALKNQPVLLVGESEGFDQQGGDVNFFVEANKIRFEINVDAAKQQRLKVSAKLLALAKIISSESDSPPGSAPKVTR